MGFQTMKMIATELQSRLVPNGITSRWAGTPSRDQRGRELDALGSCRMGSIPNEGDGFLFS